MNLKNLIKKHKIKTLGELNDIVNSKGGYVFVLSCKAGDWEKTIKEKIGVGK